MKDSKTPVDRRAMLAGAGTVGALAAAAALLPGAKSPGAQAPAGDATPQPDTAAGYRLTEHVKRYYATARI